MKTIEYTIAEYYLPALINGDYTGLSDEAEYDLEMFLAKVNLPTGHWSQEDYSKEFAKCDVSGLMSECAHIDYVVSQTD